MSAEDANMIDFMAVMVGVFALALVILIVLIIALQAELQNTQERLASTYLAQPRVNGRFAKKVQ